MVFAQKKPRYAAKIMEKENFLNNIKHIAKADREILRADIDQASMLLPTSNIGQESILEKATPSNSTAATVENCITPEEFQQGVFLKIMLKSLPEAVPPHDFVEQVMRRAAPQSDSKPKVWKKLAAVVMISVVSVGGVVLGIHSSENTDTTTIQQEIAPYQQPTILPNTEQRAHIPTTTTTTTTAGSSPTLARKSSIKTAKKQNLINYKMPQKGDSTIVPTEGPTPED